MLKMSYLGCKKRHEISKKHVRKQTDKNSCQNSHQRIVSMIQVSSQELNEQNGREQKRIEISNLSKRKQILDWIQNQFQLLKQRIQCFCNIFNGGTQVGLDNQDKKGRKQISQNYLEKNHLFKQFSERIQKFLSENIVTMYQHLQPKQNNISKSKLQQGQYENQLSFNHFQSIQSVKILNLNSIKKKLNNSSKQVKSQSNNTQNVFQRTLLKQFATQQKSIQSAFQDKIPISCSSTISQLLYKQAKNKDFVLFHQFCQRILLEKKPIISQLHFLKSQKIQRTNQYLDEINKKLTLLNCKLIDVFPQNSTICNKIFRKQQIRKQLGQEINQICMILKKLNQQYSLKTLTFICNQPCCKYQQKISQNATKANKLLNLRQTVKGSINYKAQFAQQYFSRYYGKASFDRSRIYSLSRTKTEQMQQIQKKYKKNKENTKSCQKIKKRSNSLCATMNNNIDTRNYLHHQKYSK